MSTAENQVELRNQLLSEVNKKKEALEKYRGRRSTSGGDGTPNAPPRIVGNIQAFNEVGECAKASSCPEFDISSVQVMETRFSQSMNIEDIPPLDVIETVPSDSYTFSNSSSTTFTTTSYTTTTTSSSSQSDFTETTASASAKHNLISVRPPSIALTESTAQCKLIRSGSSKAIMASPSSKDLTKSTSSSTLSATNLEPKKSSTSQTITTNSTNLAKSSSTSKNGNLFVYDMGNMTPRSAMNAASSLVFQSSEIHRQNEMEKEHIAHKKAVGKEKDKNRLRQASLPVSQKEKEKEKGKGGDKEKESPKAGLFSPMLFFRRNKQSNQS